MTNSTVAFVATALFALANTRLAQEASWKNEQVLNARPFKEIKVTVTSNGQ